MKSLVWRFAAATLLGVATGALAAGECGMNTNNPCPTTEKLGSKEPAYKSMNSNKPQSTQAPGAAPAKEVKAAAEKAPAKAAAEKAPAKAAADKAPAKAAKTAPAEVKGAGGEKAQGKASLSGVSGSDLKVKPQDPPTSQKEPAK